MNYKNGYKVLYEVAANGERTFYATKSNTYPTRDEAGNITDDLLGSFVDTEFAGKTVYEHAGTFYKVDTTVAKFDEEGNPVGEKIDNFDVLFSENVSTETVDTSTTVPTEPEGTTSEEPEIPPEETEEPDELPVNESTGEVEE